jgi:hypothetical protein
LAWAGFGKLWDALFEKAFMQVCGAALGCGWKRAGRCRLLRDVGMA